MVQFRMKIVNPRTGILWTEAYWHSSNTLCQFQGQVQHPWILNIKKKSIPPPPHKPWMCSHCSRCSVKALWMLIQFSYNAPWMRPQFSKCPLPFTCIKSYFQNFNLQVYTYYTLPLKALWMFIQFSYNAPCIRPQFSKDPQVMYTYPMILPVLPTPRLPLPYSPII